MQPKRTCGQASAARPESIDESSPGLPSAACAASCTPLTLLLAASQAARFIQMLVNVRRPAQPGCAALPWPPVPVAKVQVS